MGDAASPFGSGGEDPAFAVSGCPLVFTATSGLLVRCLLASARADRPDLRANRLSRPSSTTSFADICARFGAPRAAPRRGSRRVHPFPMKLLDLPGVAGDRQIGDVNGELVFVAVPKLAALARGQNALQLAGEHQPALLLPPGDRAACPRPPLRRRSLPFRLGQRVPTPRAPPAVSFRLNKNLGRPCACSCQALTASWNSPRSPRFSRTRQHRQQRGVLHRRLPLRRGDRVAGAEPILRTQPSARHHGQERVEALVTGLGRVLAHLGLFLMSVAGLHGGIPVQGDLPGQAYPHRFGVARDPLRADHPGSPT